MAWFSVQGMDELMADFKKAGKVPEEVTSNMLKAMAEKTKDAQAKLAATMLQGPYTTGTTQSVLSIGKPKLDETGGKIFVSFKGSRTRGNTTTRNAAIAFINEFGKKSQAARPFIKTANTQNEEKINEAGAEVFYDWLKKNNL